MRFKHIFLALGLVAAPLLAFGASSINPTVPATNAPMSSAPIRNNFLASYNDINNIESKFGSTIAPLTPSTRQDWFDTTTSTAWNWKVYDGGQWVSIGTLNPTTHVWTAAVGGSVTSFSAGSTGLTPSSATAGAVTLAGILSGANGGTGVANTGKTITLGGNVSTSSTVSVTGALSTSAALSTTGAGATTLAFGASTQTYTFPTTTATIARTDAGQTFTGANTFSSGTTFSSAITYGGVALSNAVTGTGNMVLSASPTFTGTVSGAAATLTGTLTTNVTGGGTQCAQVSNTGVLSGTGTACTSSVPVPTVQKFTTGSGTYTTPAGVRQLYVRMWAGGGGGGNWNGADTAGTGGTTSFGSTTAIGGSPGLHGQVSTGAGGIGGTGGSDTGATTPIRISGQQGQSGLFNAGGSGQGPICTGGASFGGAGNNANSSMGYGGGGNGATGFGASTGGVAGSGGGGCGGGGEYVEFLVNSPGATISYAVGAGGIASSGGSANGVAGTGGAIFIQERY